MPTFERTPEFAREFKHLSTSQRHEFMDAIRQWVRNIKAHGLIPTDSRVEGIKGAPGIFEFRWAANGRATFSFGNERRHGEPHIIWRRIGTHDVLRRP